MDANPDTISTETLPNGTTRVWTRIGHRYTRLAAWRDEINTAIASIAWHDARRRVSLPFMPGMALKQIITDLGFDRNYIAAVGYSHHSLTYPEDHLLDGCTTDADLAAIHPEHLATYQLLAIRELTRPGWRCSYWLDTGTTAVCLATDHIPVPRHRHTRFHRRTHRAASV